MKSATLNGDRICLEKDDSRVDILKLIASQGLKVLQFSSPLPQRLMDSLNEEFFVHRPDVELRAFGFYGEVCDLSFCSRMFNVRKFRADCIQSATSVEHIGRMRHLESLGLGIYDLSSFEMLQDLNANMKELFLLQTKSKKPDLAGITHFHCLQRLCLVGQQKNIEVLSLLQTLEDLTLGSITVGKLCMIRDLPNLRFLRVILGGTNNLADIEGMSGLKSLELRRIVGLENIDVIATLTGLQSLSLKELVRITELPSFAKLGHLRRIILDGLKSLSDISTLESSPSMTELSHVSAKTSPDDYRPLLNKGELKYANVGFGSIRKNDQFKQLCSEHGVVCGVNPSFIFK